MSNETTLPRFEVARARTGWLVFDTASDSVVATMGTLADAERRAADLNGAEPLWRIEEWMEKDRCAGSGTRWRSGNMLPICRVCHRSPRALGVPRPTRVRPGGPWSGIVPEHEQRKG